MSLLAQAIYELEMVCSTNISHTYDHIYFEEPIEQILVLHFGDPIKYHYACSTWIISGHSFFGSCILF
jgi:hypothetical protein